MINIDDFIRQKVSVVSLLLVVMGKSFGQLSSIVISLDQLDEVEEMSLVNPFPIDTSGGHLQGVQIYSKGDDKYAFMSGSSSETSYLMIVDLAAQSVHRICTLFASPLKHAGGFQITDHFLAVGIEDDVSRTESKVQIYDVDDLLSGKIEPLNVIHRKGLFERSTAGGVALAKLDAGWLLIVADWDSRNIDFYGNAGEIRDPFSLVQTLTMQQADRRAWSDQEWSAYQNINLLLDHENLFLAGLTSVESSVNIIDLYRVDKAQGNFALTKIMRKNLANRGGNFIWSAGLNIGEQNILGAVSTSRNVEKNGILYFYK